MGRDFRVFLSILIIFQTGQIPLWADTSHAAIRTSNSESSYHAETESNSRPIAANRDDIIIGEPTLVLASELADKEAARLTMAAMIAAEKYANVINVDDLNPLALDDSAWKAKLGKSMQNVGAWIGCLGISLVASGLSFGSVASNEYGWKEGLLWFGGFEAAGFASIGLDYSSGKMGKSLRKKNSKLSEDDLELFKAGLEAELDPVLTYLENSLNGISPYESRFNRDDFLAALRKEALKKLKIHLFNEEIRAYFPKFTPQEIIDLIQENGLAHPDQVRALIRMEQARKIVQENMQIDLKNFQRGQWLTKDEKIKMRAKAIGLEYDLNQMKMVQQVYDKISQDPEIQKNENARSECRRIAEQAGNAIKKCEDLIKASRL